MSGPDKVTVKPKYIAYGLLYLGLITVASYFTIEKAFSRSQELSQYHIDKTRKFLGEEKAEEMRAYIKGEDRDLEGDAEGAPAAEESEVSGTEEGGSEE